MKNYRIPEALLQNIRTIIVNAIHPKLPLDTIMRALEEMGLLEQIQQDKKSTQDTK